MSKKSSLSAFLSSNTGRKFFNMFYSWGASIVIIGAMCKILHLPGANGMLMFGMITEALVFFISGFDSEQAGIQNETSAQGGGFGGVIVQGDVSGVQGSSAGVGSDNIAAKPSTSGGIVGGTGGAVASSGVINLGSRGGSNGGSSTSSSSSNDGDSNSTSGGATDGSITGGGSANIDGKMNLSGDGANVAGGGSFVVEGDVHITAEYAENVQQAAKHMSEFAKTIDSLNEVSQSLVVHYKDIVDNSKDISDTSKGFSDNMKSLQENVSGLNEVYETQLNSVKDQMDALRFLNDSLQRIKRMYDGAALDSATFRDETERMTRQIHALNGVYSRLLQAMNANVNMNNNNTPPPIY